MSPGIAPTLEELVALRAAAGRRGSARKGAYHHAGPAASPVRGRGMEYAESREYVAGDDVRHIDWRLTARTGRTHTKLFQAERERLSLVVADTAPALFFGTRERYKSVQAARAGAVAAWAALHEGDRLSVIGTVAGEAPLPPAAGSRGVLRVLDALVRWYAQPRADSEGLQPALQAAQRLLRPGSRLVVLADPHSVQQVPEPCWLQLAAHNEVTVLLLVDPLELEPPRKALPFATTGGRLELDLADERQRQRWRKAFVEPLQSAQARLPACGVRAIRLRSDEDSAAWLHPSAGAQLQGA